VVHSHAAAVFEQEHINMYMDVRVWWRGCAMVVFLVGLLYYPHR
jgi:hypothetical protein